MTRPSLDPDDEGKDVDERNGGDGLNGLNHVITGIIVAVIAAAVIAFWSMPSDVAVMKEKVAAQQAQINTLNREGSPALHGVVADIANLKAAQSKAEIEDQRLLDAIEKLRDSTAHLDVAVGELQQLVNRALETLPERRLGPHSDAAPPLPEPIGAVTLPDITG